MGCTQSSATETTKTIQAPLNLELTYFDIPGRAEYIRLLFAYSGVAFKDTRYSFPDYFANKNSLDLPFNQVPTLHANNHTYGQSLAIARYVAKLSGLYPTDPLIALEADSIVDAIAELFNAVVDAVFKTKDEVLQQTKFDTINNDTIPNMMSRLEARVSGIYFTGADISLADIALFDFAQNTMAANEKITATLTSYPKLQAIVHRVGRLPQLQSYLTK